MSKHKHKLCKECEEEYKKTWQTFNNIKGEIVIPPYVHCHADEEIKKEEDDSELEKS